MAELVDAVDSKSTSSDRVPVRVRMEAPVKNNEHLVRFLFWLLLLIFVYYAIIFKDRSCNYEKSIHCFNLYWYNTF